jgi:serine/threonine protein kinase
MGEVYRARDTRLKRDVAIKILPELFAADPERLARFQREAEVLASLNHPNIAAIYGIEEASGVHALVLEFVQGETLADRIASSPLDVGEVVGYGIEIAEGLAAIHEHGLIHRDLKPSNLMVARSGIKLLDFGVAKQHTSEEPALDSAQMTDLSRVGDVVGTLQYMSPEQLEGKPLDARSDLFSFGVVLYESLTGVQPFRAPSQAATVAAILRCRPKPIRELRSDTPPSLARAVMRCLNLDTHARWQSAADLGAVLKAIMASATPARTPRLQSPARPDRPQRHTSIVTLAVLPFENVSGVTDDEFLSEALAEHVAGAVGRIHGLRIISVSSTRTYRGTTKTPREIGAELQVKKLLMGTITRSGQRIHMSVHLIDANTEHRLWSATYERTLNELADVQTELAESIASELGLQLLSSGRQSRSAPVAPEAQEAYLRGRFHLSLRTEDSIREAYGFLATAVQKAPEYALAHSALAEWYVIVMRVDRLVGRGEAIGRAKVEAFEALRLNPQLAQAYSVLRLIALREYDLVHAREACEKAIELDPSDAAAYMILARCSAALENYREATRYARLAEQLDPLSRRTHLTSLSVALAAGDYRGCLAQCEIVRRLTPIQDDGPLLYFSGLGWPSISPAIPMVLSKISRAPSPRRAIRHGLSASRLYSRRNSESPTWQCVLLLS